MNLELTLPGNTQTLIITRAESRTPVPPRERISELAKHGATMALYLSVHLISEVIHEIMNSGAYTKETPGSYCLSSNLGRRKNNQGNTR